MFDFDVLANAIPRQTVLCIGDLMLDLAGEGDELIAESSLPFDQVA